MPRVKGGTYKIHINSRNSMTRPLIRRHLCLLVLTCYTSQSSYLCGAKFKMLWVMQSKKGLKSWCQLFSVAPLPASVCVRARLRIASCVCVCVFVCSVHREAGRPRVHICYGVLLSRSPYAVTQSLFFSSPTYPRWPPQSSLFNRGMQMLYTHTVVT